MDLSIRISGDELEVFHLNSLETSPSSLILENCKYQYGVQPMYVSSLWFHRSTRLRGNPDEMLCNRAEAKVSIVHACSIAASEPR